MVLGPIGPAECGAPSGTVERSDVRPAVDDPWRLAEWHALADVCFIEGCNSESGICERAPIYLTDGSIWKACTEHWEAIYLVLGEQTLWERTDGARHIPVAQEGAPG